MVVVDPSQCYVYCRETEVRFGLVCDIDMGFQLNDYFTKPEMLHHLQRKQSHITAADHIDNMTQYSFSANNGDRTDVSCIRLL